MGWDPDEKEGGGRGQAHIGEGLSYRSKGKEEKKVRWNQRRLGTTEDGWRRGRAELDRQGGRKRGKSDKKGRGGVIKEKNLSMGGAKSPEKSPLLKEKKEDGEVEAERGEMGDQEAVGESFSQSGGALPPKT